MAQAAALTPPRTGTTESGPEEPCSFTPGWVEGTGPWLRPWCQRPRPGQRGKESCVQTGHVVGSPAGSQPARGVQRPGSTEHMGSVPWLLALCPRRPPTRRTGVPFVPSFDPKADQRSLENLLGPRSKATGIGGLRHPARLGGHMECCPRPGPALHRPPSRGRVPERRGEALGLRPADRPSAAASPEPGPRGRSVRRHVQNSF